MNVDFTGEWSADLAASRLHVPPPNEILFSIAHSEPALQAELRMTLVDPTASFTFAITGRSRVTVARSPWSIGTMILLGRSRYSTGFAE